MLSGVRLFSTLWAVDHQAALCSWDSLGETTGVGCYGLLWDPWDLPNPGIKPAAPATLALQVDSLLLIHQGSPGHNIYMYI